MSEFEAGLKTQLRGTGPLGETLYRWLYGGPDDELAALLVALELAAASGRRKGLRDRRGNERRAASSE